jgi:hypothetical protein
MRATVLISSLILGTMIRVFAATNSAYERPELVLLDKSHCSHKCYLVKAGNVNGKFIPIVELDEVVISAERPVKIK